MLPEGYVGLVVADTRRAMEWEHGLAAAGFDVVRIEASGRDADKGSWQVAVRRGQAREARALVTDVIRGEARLPSRPLLPRFGRIALFAVFAVIALVSAIVLIGR